MARWSSAAPRRLGLRAVLAGCALGALVWSVAAARDDLSAGPFETVADRISVGHQYRPEAIKRALPFVEQAEQSQGCSRLFRDTSTIRVQARQLAIEAGDKVQAERHLVRAIQDLENDLACAPTRAYSWFMLFTMRAVRDNRVAPHLPLLAMSYEMGPYEGSFSPLRARAALPFLAVFGPNMTSYVERDYLAIAREQTPIAADIFAQSSESTRTRLTALLKTMPAATRATIVARLDELKAPVPPDLEGPTR